VVEIYDNVTQLAAAIRTTRWQVMGLSVLLLSGLYVALLIIIGRAERILREKARALEIEIDRRMKIAEELQRSVQATETARRATENAYAAALAARRDAEAANNVKSELLQSLGESLRTPVNRAIGLLDVLLASLSSEPHRQHLAAAREQSLALLDLIAQKTQDGTAQRATRAL
jgi:signal transduction histidine kinase